MAGKSLLAASEEQRAALRSLAESRDRGEADRARSVLLTLAGWTSSRIAEAFGVREDTVRLWRRASSGASNLRCPRATIRRASSGRGRCSVSATFAGAVIQRSTSSGVDDRVRFGRQEGEQVVGRLALLHLPN